MYFKTTAELAGLSVDLIHIAPMMATYNEFWAGLL